MPSARRIDALYSAKVAAPRRPRASLVRAGSRGRRRHRRARRSTTLTVTTSSARRRKTSSSDVSRVESRYSGSSSSAMTSRSVSRSSSPSISTSTRPSAATARRRTGPSAATNSSRARTDVDGHGARAFEQCIGRAGDDQTTRVDHHDVVAHLLHVVEQVGGHQHGDAERSEPSNEREHVIASDRIEAGGRFVEQDELGIARRSPGRACVRCRIPVENSPIGRNRASSRPTRSRMSDARCRAARAGSPLNSPNVETTSAAVWSRGRQSCSGM